MSQYINDVTFNAKYSKNHIQTMIIKEIPNSKINVSSTVNKICALTEQLLIEIDCDHDWIRCIGQLQIHSVQYRTKQKVLFLIDGDNSDREYDIIVGVCKSLNIHVVSSINSLIELNDIFMQTSYAPNKKNDLEKCNEICNCRTCSLLATTDALLSAYSDFNRRSMMSMHRSSKDHYFGGRKTIGATM